MARALPIADADPAPALPAGSLARVFQALSDPTRLAVLELLRGGERCVCDLTEVMETGQSRLSFHLKTLRDAGLVADRKAGRWVYYSLREEALGAAVEAMASLHGSARQRAGASASGCCG
jgi:ArsR family transcriptional regulator